MPVDNKNMPNVEHQSFELYLEAMNEPHKKKSLAMLQRALDMDPLNDDAACELIERREKNYQRRLEAFSLMEASQYQEMVASGEISKRKPVLSSTLHHHSYLRLLARIASCYLHLDQLQNARTTLEKYLRLDPTDFIFLHPIISKIYIRQNDTQAFDKLWRKFPKDEIIYPTDRAFMEIYHGSFEIAYLILLNEVFPSNPYFFFFLALNLESVILDMDFAHREDPLLQEYIDYLNDFECLDDPKKEKAFQKYCTKHFMAQKDVSENDLALLMFIFIFQEDHPRTVLDETRLRTEIAHPKSKSKGDMDVFFLFSGMLSQENENQIQDSLKHLIEVNLVEKDHKNSLKVAPHGYAYICLMMKRFGLNSIASAQYPEESYEDDISGYNRLADLGKHH